jgi:hypothetical protein
VRARLAPTPLRSAQLKITSAALPRTNGGAVSVETGLSRTDVCGASRRCSCRSKWEVTGVLAGEFQSEREEETRE